MPEKLPRHGRKSPGAGEESGELQKGGAWAMLMPRFPRRCPRLPYHSQLQDLR